MAVYTNVTVDQISKLLLSYNIGQFVSLKGITEGVENTNYILTTTRDRYILTLYEKRVNPNDLPFFIELMDHLSLRQINCPRPIHDLHGNVLQKLAGKSAALTSFLSGAWPRQISEDHCAAVGAALAKMHIAGRDFPKSRRNALSRGGWRKILTKLPFERHSTAYLAGLWNELGVLERHWPQNLPIGVIHADLFPDNVFFEGTRVSGLIDFYFACTDAFAYDIAICVDAWCFDAEDSFSLSKERAFLDGYQEYRRLEESEQEALPFLFRGASLRFLLTRLYDSIHTPQGALVKPKDPEEYRRKLLHFSKQLQRRWATKLD